MKSRGLVPAWLATSLLAPVVTSGRVTNPSKVPAKAMLLSQVSTLTLRDGKRTAARRTDPVPQLQCVGPAEVCALYRVDVMRCANEGADYDAENVQWSCKASLPDEFKLGATDVVCEGYESADDPYVLKGSCGVEYRLLLTDKGEEKYGGLGSQGDREGSSGQSRVPAMVFFVIFLGVLLVILRGFWTQWRTNTPRVRGVRRRGWGGAGGHGGDDDDDLPPPYDGPPPYSDRPSQPKMRPAPAKTSRQSTASSSRSSAQRDRGQEQGWRPGFWTGTLAGAAAGYMAGNRGQARNESHRTTEPRPQPETRQRPGGWFGNPGTASRQQAPDRPVFGRGPSSPSNSPSYSATRHESTGFGETRRR